MWIVSASGRPEDGTSLVPGFGCSWGVFGGPVGSGFVFGPWDGLTRVVSPPLCWVLGLGAWRGFRLAGWLAGWQDLTREAVVDMIIWLYDHMVIIRSYDQWII